MAAYEVCRDIAIIIVFAKAFGLLARKIRVPQVVGEIIAGLVMWVRITGSGFATTPYEMVALKMLHALEVPLVFIGMFKYIGDVFGTRLSATIYMVGFVFAKGVGATLLSPLAGHMYEVFGFRHTYIVLGSSALLFTIISMFSLDSGKHRKPARLDLR